ncbi:MAG: hypothetical protein KF883_09855 [Thermomicrobiales bacterium]|nr:hypothetical protein [Thermomicrobiales bacterium]
MPWERRYVGNDTIEGVAALVGITLGVVPIVRLALGGQLGFFYSWLPESLDGAALSIAPALLLAACVFLIVLLEQSKRHVS